MDLIVRELDNVKYAAVLAAVYMALYSNFAEQETAIAQAMQSLPEADATDAIKSAVRALMPQTLLACRRAEYTDSRRGNLITTPLYSKYHLDLLRLTHQLPSHPWALFVAHWCEKYGAKYPKGLKHLFTERQAIVTAAVVDEEPLILYSIQLLFLAPVDPNADHIPNPPHVVLQVMGKTFTFRIYEPDVRADFDALIETVDLLEAGLLPSVVPAPPAASNKPPPRVRAPADASSSSDSEA